MSRLSNFSLPSHHDDKEENTAGGLFLFFCENFLTSEQRGKKSDKGELEKYVFSHLSHSLQKQNHLIFFSIQVSTVTNFCNIMCYIYFN